MTEVYCRSISYSIQHMVSKAPCARVWELGAGPCGKLVTQLAVSTADGGLCIRQTTEDGEVRLFIIPLHTIISGISILPVPHADYDPTF